jgi:FdhE protein
MQRVLEPGQIEAFAQRAIPRLRLPDRTQVFSRRAERLRELAGDGCIGHAIGEYLRLMATVADTQQAALGAFEAKLPSAEQMAHARQHGMPPVHAAAFAREKHWRDVLAQLCSVVARHSDLPDRVHDVCERLSQLPAEQTEMEADALLSAGSEPVDPASAPLLMAALQVYWVDLASRLAAANLAALDVPLVCPVCGTWPVASVVRTDPGAQGFRYLHCALCATEWHMVRVTCTHCGGTKGIDYRSIEGGPEAIRAECCESCRTYRKILYQEKDSRVEPVADDLASLALDLLLSEAGYHRASGNPLLWQSKGSSRATVGK